MIYVVTALFCEAKPWIEAFGLKKETEFTKFQIFKNDEIKLIISKQGKLNAAIAVTALFDTYPPTKNDLILNFGIAGCPKDDFPIGNGFLCNKITDSDSGYTHYPDLLFTHSFEEALLYTVSLPFTKVSAKLKGNIHDTTTLVDMEGSGFYTASSLFLAQHQILLFKVISDHCEALQLTGEEVTNLLKPFVKPLYDYFHFIQLELSKHIESVLTQEELTYINDLADMLKFSVTMTFQLQQLFLYAKLNQVSLIPYITALLQELGETPCPSKKEGKRYLERIRNDLI